MPLSNAEQEAWAVQAFGCTQAELDEMIAEQMFVSYQMLTMSILSDAQAVMAGGNVEQARQFINKAKYIISHHWTEQR